MQIGFIGLGKLGFPVALAIESKGHDVVGYDVNPDIATYIESKKYPHKEKGLQKYLNETKIKVVPIDQVVSHSTLIFVPIQTPHEHQYEGSTRIPDERKDFNYTYLIEGVKAIVESAERQKKTVVVSIISTVLPGTIEREITPLLGVYVKLTYTPHFIAMGTVIQDYLNPEFVLLGSDDKVASELVRSFYETIHDKAILEISIKSAELAKVTYNTFISTKIAFINTVMELCHKTGADIDEVTRALHLGTDRLISVKYLTGGMGDGGGCHPRDNIAMSWIAREKNLSFDLFDAIMKQREEQTEWFAELIIAEIQGSDLPVCILGRSFKPETGIETGSPAILLSELLAEYHVEHSVTDPYTTGLLIHKPAIYFIATKHKMFAGIEFPPGSVVIDPFRYIPYQDGVKVIRIGSAQRFTGDTVSISV